MKGTSTRQLTTSEVAGNAVRANGGNAVTKVQQTDAGYVAVGNADGGNQLQVGEAPVGVQEAPQATQRVAEAPVTPVTPVTPQAIDLSQLAAQGMRSVQQRQSSQQRQQPRQEAAAPTMPVASVGSGMAEAREQMAPIPQAPQAAQQTPVSQDGGESQGSGSQIPYTVIPEDMNGIGIESKRTRTDSFQDALAAGNRLATMANDRATKAEAARVEAEEKGEERPKRQRPNRRNAAEKSIAQTEAAYQASGQEAPWWTHPVDRLTRFSQNVDLRSKKFVDKAKATAARAFKREDVGNRIYGKIIGYNKIGFQEIGVGYGEINAVIRQNPQMLENLLRENLGDEIPVITTMSTKDLIKFINSHDIWVATFKPPNNQGPDIQRRKLRIMTNSSRGIFLHSYMSAMYTADYDGDDMEVSLDPNVAKYAKDPMEHMVDIYGKTLLNSDFVPVAQIFEKDGMSREEYVRDYILSDILDINGRIVEGVDDLGREIYRNRLSYVAPLVNAILELADAHDKDGDTRSARYADVFREAKRFADHLTKNRAESNAYTSQIIESVVDDMQRREYSQTLSAVDGDILMIDANAVPKPVTRGDAAIYKVIDGIVKGAIPNNFQELKLMLTGFVGNVEGKNAPFRFTADVGKMMKMDERLLIKGSIDLNSDEDMELFFQTTMKFAGSLKMARDIKQAGRSEFYTQVFRQRVIEEVRFPEMYRDSAGNIDFPAFLTAFAKAYNHHSAVINQANLVFLTNMGISSENAGVISELDKSGIVRGKDGSVSYNWTMSDLAEPMLSVYGTYSVSRIFGEGIGQYMLQHRRDDFAAENPKARKRENSLEREYNYHYKNNFWITGRYLEMNLRQFRNENHLIYLKEDIGRIRERTISDLYKNNSGPGVNINAQFDILMAIADKRTGAASKYNQYTFGEMEKGHRFNEKSVVNQMSMLLVSVRNAMRKGSQVIAPGYYAGIGQREFESDAKKKEVEGHMTSLATRLANMGGVYGSWVLRSGDAEGSDQAFQIGAGRASNIYKASKDDKVSDNAKGSVLSLDTLSDSDRQKAYAAVTRLHPSGGDVSNPASLDLLARDYFQVMGSDLEGGMKSAFIACYADGKEQGTWQAIRIAREMGIPVFNMAEYDDYSLWEDDVIDAAVRAYSGNLYTEPVGHDQILEIDEALQALRMADPDLFSYYNMDSTSAFLESPYGQKMLQYADNVEMLGGIYTTMIYEYRMDRITSLSDDLLSLDDTTRLQETWDELLLAKDELASASSVWNGIIKEIEAESTDGDHSFFEMIHNGGVKQVAEDGYVYPWSKNVTYDAADFWGSDNGRHPTLTSVINDLDLDRRTKWNVIVDVVRYWNKDGFIKSYEIGYQMEVASDSSYAIGGAPGRSVLGVSRDFNDAYGRWARRSQTRLREDVERARVTYSNQRGALMRTLQRLDAEPWELVSIDADMYADSILAVYDKTYAQTEKAKQNPWTNAIYSALSYQKVGGYMNDITRTDDRLLGLTSIDSVTVQDVIHLLANPDESLTVYDRYGRYSIVNREILLKNELGDLSGDIEADMWEFLSREPRLASAIRKHASCVQEDNDGSGYLGASHSISETIEQMTTMPTNELEHVRYILRDKPGYAAIISLALPGKNLITRTARKRVARIEEYLSQQIYVAASAWDAEEAAPLILADLGITQDSMRDVMKSHYDEFLEKLGLDAYKYAEKNEKGRRTLESENDADVMYGYALRWLTDYINEVKNSGMTLGNVYDEPSLDLDGTVTPDSESGFSGVGPDAVSAAAFWDVVQELSGAKTNVSTGIEGSETYRFAEWASHVKTKDHYASIQALGESNEINGRWNGMWTNLTNSDGTPVLLDVNDTRGGVSVTITRVDSSGHEVTNTYYMNPSQADLSFEDAKNACGVDEIVVEVPEGWTVRDRSTDTKGNQVASLFAYMVSKRINGAETFNLKAKKAGIDGKDSITKMMDGGKHKPGVTYDGLVAKVQDLASRQGIRSAQLYLAKMMLDENRELGYKDLTLANYMSIAELMLIEGEDGVVHLRSLEMLFTAMKYRIGFDVDNMSDEQLTEAVNNILNDNSQNGVGIAQMVSLDALDGFSPRSRSSQYSAIRQSSSVFTRNFSLMESIANNARRRGVEPISKNETDAIHSSLLRAIQDVFKSNGIGRAIGGYKIVSLLEDTSGLNSRSYRTTIGPANALFIMSGSKGDIDTACRSAYSNGMTVLFPSYVTQSLPENLRKSVVQVYSDDNIELCMLPMFDIRLNGMEASPNHAQFAMAPVDYSQYVVSVEDSTNEFRLGDAAAQAFTSLTDRMSVKDGGSRQLSIESMFPNVFGNKEYRDWSKTISFPNGNIIQNLIVDDIACTIDYGLVENGRGWDQHVKNVNQAIERYRQRWEQCDKNGFLMGVDNCEPGDIVGWVDMTMTSPDGTTEQHVLAPIIPFQLYDVKRQPSNYSVGNIGPTSGDFSLLTVDWSNTSSLEDQYVKYFDSSGGANKGMISLSEAIDESRTLLDGTPIDVYIAKASTDSRKVGTDRRIKTMITLMAMARIHGYNFARNNDGTINENAFPDNPELREELYRDRIPKDRWRGILDSKVPFSYDERLDAFVRYECEKVLANGGNPSDYLANIYTDENGDTSDTHMMWEFEAMFDQGINYEDGLLRFLSFMNPVSANDHVTKFCPNGIDDVSNQNTLFRLYQEKDGPAQGYDRGVLQMRVPHKTDGGMAYMWDNVYVGLSFFGEDYSGFTRPNVDGASIFLDGMNTMSMYGVTLKSKWERDRAKWATADIARHPHSNGSFEKMREV